MQQEEQAVKRCRARCLTLVSFGRRGHAVGINRQHSFYPYHHTTRPSMEILEAHESKRQINCPIFAGVQAVKDGGDAAGGRGYPSAPPS